MNSPSDTDIEPTQPAGPPLIVAGMRFSVLTEKSLRNWRTSRSGNVNDAFRAVFAEDRMKFRFTMFEAMTLPFFRSEAARDKNFRLCILTSSFMPRPWRDRLEELVADIPQIDIVPVSITAVFQREFEFYIRRHLTPEHGTVCTIRLDDDDTLHAGHMKSLRRRCLPENIGKIMTHPNGVYLTRDDAGNMLVRDYKYISNAFGIAYLSGTGDLKTIYDTGSHAKLRNNYPMLHIKKKRAWIRSVHRMADTAGKASAPIEDGWVPLADLRDDLARLYPFLDFDRVADAFAGA